MADQTQNQSTSPSTPDQVAMQEAAFLAASRRLAAQAHTIPKLARRSRRNPLTVRPSVFKRGGSTESMPRPTPAVSIESERKRHDDTEVFGSILSTLEQEGGLPEAGLEEAEKEDKKRGKQLEEDKKEDKKKKKSKAKKAGGAECSRHCKARKNREQKDDDKDEEAKKERKKKEKMERRLRRREKRRLREEEEARQRATSPEKDRESTSVRENRGKRHS
ncbi:nucleolar protein 58-like [Benincasa hispida]|uniref:nucleolar protein 58-like n=1 Tax=Benincasa hispida TaxID=102211 RepID=UPI0018FFAC23|nr:nucleolar protein 58-like [Benincasa hispida]